MDIRPRIAHYTSIIMMLREMGYDIPCRSYWQDGVHMSEYTFNGISLKPREKHKKGCFTQEDMDKNYEAWYQACRVQYDLIPKKRGRPLGSKNK